MNIRDLEYLIAVADLGHFGRAAEACFVSQPSLSIQIKKLEEELGLEIFERTNKRVLITPPGQEIIRQAREVLLAKNALLDLAKQLKDPFEGSFRLGVIPSLGPYLLPHILPVLKKTFPKLLLSIIENETEALVSMLHHGDLDAIIASMPVDLFHLAVHPLFEEPFYAVFNKNSPASRQSAIHIEDLYEENIILLEKGHCLSEQILNICVKLRAQKTKNDFSLSSLETLYYLIVAGEGMSLFPSLAIKSRIENPNIIVRPFFPPAPVREICMCWRATSYRNLLCNKVAESIVHWSSTQNFGSLG